MKGRISTSKIKIIILSRVVMPRELGLRGGRGGRRGGKGISGSLRRPITRGQADRLFRYQEPSVQAGSPHQRAALVHMLGRGQVKTSAATKSKASHPQCSPRTPLTTRAGTREELFPALHRYRSCWMESALSRGPRGGF